MAESEAQQVIEVVDRPARFVEVMGAIRGVPCLQNDFYPSVDSRHTVFALVATIWENGWDWENDWGWSQIHPDLEIEQVALLFAAVDLASGEEFDNEDRYQSCTCGCDRYAFHLCSNCDEVRGPCCECHVCANRSCRERVSSVCDNCDACGECCNCPECEGCNRNVSSVCDTCNQCDSCCSCANCDNCGRRITAPVCEDCDRCQTCCRCSTQMTSITEGRPWPADSIMDRQINCSKRLAGIEWEINKAETVPALKRWAKQWRGGIHSDGSCGWEMVTPPLAGDHVVKCITDLGDALESSDAVVDARCGIHVHVDAKDFYWEDMYRLLHVYAHIEPILFALGGQNRFRGEYCRRAGPLFKEALSALDRKNQVLAIVHACNGSFQSTKGRDTAKEKSMYKKMSGRYHSLNIIPWLSRFRGGKVLAPDATVEFRLHKHSLSKRRVLEWTLLCIRIIDWVAKASHAEAMAVTKLSALQALATIAPESRKWILERIRDWRRATSRRTGVRRSIRFNEGEWKCAV